MRTLCVVCRDPFEHRDGATYATRASLVALAARGGVTLAGFGPTFDEPSRGGYPCAGSLGAVRNSPGAFLASLVRRRSYTLDKYSSREAIERFGRILDGGRYDVVWYEQTQAAAVAYRSGVLSERGGNTLHVLRSHNVEANVVTEREGALAGLGAPLLSFERRLLTIGESAIVSSMDRVLTITEEDARTYRASPQCGSAWIEYAPVPAPAVAQPASSRRDRDAVVFMGTLGWKPNAEAARWLCRELAPRMAKELPSLRIRLMGRGTDALRNDCPGNVCCLGFVEDLRDELASALCTIAPVRSGGGVNIKVLESLAHGVPVVGTAFARRGVHGDAFLEAETAADFIAEIGRLHRNRALAETLRVDAVKVGARAREMFDEVIEAALYTRGTRVQTSWGA